MIARAEIIAIGTELVSGKSVDTNSAYLSDVLFSRGIPVVRHTTVPDSMCEIKHVLSAARQRGGLIVITGGLGPTKDDLTRQAVAEVYNRPLCESGKVMDAICRIFQRYGRPMPENNRIQAMVPRGADVIWNPVGTACGFTIRETDATMMVLPGVPSEMKEMFQAQIPEIVRRFSKGLSRLRTLHVIGLSESSVGERLQELMGEHRNPYVGLLAHDHVITVEIFASGGTRQEVNRLLRNTSRKVRRALGRHVFGADSDTLERVVGKLLRNRGYTLAVAESCTGGLLGSLLTDVPGSSAYFLGGIQAYADEAKVQFLGVTPTILQHDGAVSEAAAGRMAEGVMERFDADVGLAITGIAGPGGGTGRKPVGLVYVACAITGGTTLVRRLHLHGSRAKVKARAAKACLNLLRLHLCTP